jgi:hypothetical protein
MQFLVAGILTDDRFIETFRLSKPLFEWLCGELYTDLAPAVHGMSSILTCGMCDVVRSHSDSFAMCGTGVPFGVGKLIAMALYRWASGASYRVVGDVFRCGKTTVWIACRDVGEAIIKNLGSRVIRYACCFI